MTHHVTVFRVGDDRSYPAPEPFGSPEAARRYCVDDIRRRLKNVLAGLDWQAAGDREEYASCGSYIYRIAHSEEKANGQEEQPQVR